MSADSPDPVHAEAVEHRLVAHNRKILQLGLGNQHAIEWIPALAGEVPCALCMDDRDVERREALAKWN